MSSPLTQLPCLSPLQKRVNLKVSEDLRGPQPSYSSTTEITVFSSQAALDVSTAFTELKGKEVVSSSEQVEENTTFTVAGGIALLNVPLPPMVEGVTLPVNGETLQAGDRTPSRLLCREEAFKAVEVR